ncbi:hypothetical protein BGZ83_011766 [Gryganskiella cystojenkinii]|nr:hypothetical protein BGZ83_011766 [Gryganskiella cystojenkinii]
MGEQTIIDAPSAAFTTSTIQPTKLGSLASKTTTTTTITSTTTVKQRPMPQGLATSIPQQSLAQPLSPTLTITPPESFGSSSLQEEKKSSSATATSAAGTAAGTLHKKDSGTSMASSVDSLQSNHIINGTAAQPPTMMMTTTTTSTTAEPSNATFTLPPRRAQQSFPPPAPSSHASAILDSSSLSLPSPSEKVLSRPLSTSKLSSTPLIAPHILPNQRYAGFNLAALGQLSPPASQGASLTISRADTLAFLTANGPSHNSYFSLSATSSGTKDDSSSLHGSETGEGGERERPHRPMCGLDAISLLDLDDPHNDMVFIDSNGNSSGSGVTGAAMVGESMASALAIVSHHHSQPSQKSLESLAGVSGTGGNAGGGGLGGTLAAGLTMTASASQAFLAGVAGSTGTLLGIDHSGFHGDNTTGGSSSGGASSISGTGTISSGSNSQPRSSLPSLTSQARKDVLQRAAMIAAIQQNGGAKIMAAQQRMGRRQDRPSRNIRFGEFHRICEIEYGFDEGKPLLANGRTLIHSICVQRINADDSTEDMQLYLFSDILVSGTKIGTLCPKPESLTSEDDPCALEELKPEGQELEEEGQKDDDTDSTVSIVDQGSSPQLRASKPELEATMASTSSLNSTLVKNPYAGDLKNQKICRLIQVQADVIENDATARDGFLSLLNSTILAHKHHLLFQSKYLADLKKFKRHSAFSFDTSFLKTWGLHNGLNLGSMVKTNGNGTIMGHQYYNGGIDSPGAGPSSGAPTTIDGTGTLTNSPLVSPGGAFDPYQYQQHLNRPQSMAGSLFSFAMNGGSFPSFTSSTDHSKDGSSASSASYATLKGTNAANALQYHHQQQQQILQNRLSMHAAASAAAVVRQSGPTANPYQSQRSSAVIDRSSTGSTFDPMWFLKGIAGGDSSTMTTKPSRKSISIADIVHLHTDLDGNEGDRKVEEVSIEDLLAMKAAASANAAAAGTGNAMDLSATITPGNLNNNNRLSSSSFASFMPSSSSQTSIATLKSQPGWVRDEDATVCMVCSITKFGVLVRKHHCRLCGRVICWKCCQMKDAALFGEQGLLAAAASGGGAGAGTIANIGGATGELGVVSAGGKAIRACLDCIDQHQETAAEIQHHLLRNPRRASAPTSPTSPTSSFPLHGVFGKLMSASTAGGASHLAPAVVTSGPALSSSQFYPRPRSGLAPYPHHHRASLYRIDVERVGEEEEEEDEEDKEKAAKKADPTTTPPPTPTLTGAATMTSTSASDTTTAAAISAAEVPEVEHDDDGSEGSSEETHAFNEEEMVKEEIMSLESEVESLLIHQSSVAAAAMASAAPPTIPFGMAPRASGTGGSKLSGGSKTKVLRGIPKELLTQRMYESAMKGGAEMGGRPGDEEEEEEEEKTMEELLAEQDEELINLIR